MQKKTNEAIALERFHRFYKTALLSPQNKLLPDTFLYPAIRNLLTTLYAKGVGAINQTTLFSAIRDVETEAVIQWYWSLHNEAYIARLHSLTKQLPPSLTHKNTKAIIIIAAMNEVDIATAIDAAKNAYQGNFEKDISVIVYHNYKAEPDADVQKAISRLQKRKNVFVIHEKVDQKHDVYMAKKVATDIVQFHIGDAVAIPFLLLDADVVMLTKGMLNETFTSLNRLDVLAVSPQYDFDPAMKRKFPVLGTVWAIDKKMREHLFEQGILTPMALGFFVGIARKVLAMVGGLKVITVDAFQEIQPILIDEDVQLSLDLLHAVGYDHYGFLDFWKDYPIISLREDGHTIYLDASREVFDLINGHPFDYRWKQHRQYYLTISGTKRLVLPNAADYAHVPELGEMTQTNLTKALNRHWKSIYTLPGLPPEKQHIFSKVLLSTLQELGFATTFSAVHGKDREQTTRLHDLQVALDLILNTNEWQIAEFKTVTKLKDELLG